MANIVNKSDIKNFLEIVLGSSIFVKKSMRSYLKSIGNHFSMNYYVYVLFGFALMPILLSPRFMWYYRGSPMGKALIINKVVYIYKSTSEHILVVEDVKTHRKFTQSVSRDSYYNKDKGDVVDYEDFGD